MDALTSILKQLAEQKNVSKELRDFIKSKK